MRLHFFQHEPFECPFLIEAWAVKNNFVISSTHFYKESALPNLNEIDWLVVMGGSMSVNDEDQLPWLKEEKEFVKQAIETNKVVIGVCLGAQLIANVLGSKVYPNKQKEIGWFPVKFHNKADVSFASHLPNELITMHWHGETFDLPAGAVLLAESEACKNQVFIYNNRVLGLQFHLEFDERAIEGMLKNCGTELVSGAYIQTEKEILAGLSHIQSSQQVLTTILDAFL